MHPAADIIVGCDHAAWPLKQDLVVFLEQRGLTVEDAGTDRADVSVDYSEYGCRVARAVSEERVARGLLLCGTGLGMSMAANRFKGVRAALCTGIYHAVMARRHNDANVLVLGGRVTGPGLAREIVAVWLDTPFDGGRHQGRIARFDRLGE